jgi:hypothetical protein
MNYVLKYVIIVSCHSCDTNIYSSFLKFLCLLKFSDIEIDIAHRRSGSYNGMMSLSVTTVL